MENNYRSSVLVEIPDYKAYLVIDASSLYGSGFSIQTIAVWQGKDDLREYVEKSEKRDHQVFCYLANKVDKDK